MNKIMSLQSKEKQDELTHKIIGCAMEVHNTLGNGSTLGWSLRPTK
jgi:hypothetical protein